MAQASILHPQRGGGPSPRPPLGLSPLPPSFLVEWVQRRAVDGGTGPALVFSSQQPLRTSVQKVVTNPGRQRRAPPPAAECLLAPRAVCADGRPPRPRWGLIRLSISSEPPCSLASDESSFQTPGQTWPHVFLSGRFPEAREVAPRRVTAAIGRHRLVNHH